MDDRQIYDVLTEIFRALFDRSDLVLAPHLTAKDIPGWNSFQQIEIILAVEERFAITLSSSDVDALDTVGDLAGVIAVKSHTA